MERWKDVVGYEGFYKVSDKGRVKSVDREVRAGNRHNSKISTRTVKGRVLKQQENIDGYLIVCLSKHGDVKYRRVHRLVLKAFKGVRKSLQGNHLDFDRKNNKLSNLEWCTCKENINHTVRNGRWNPGVGEKSSSAKLTESQVLEIRKACLYKTHSYNELAEIYNVHPATISDIFRRKSWKHI